MFLVATQLTYIPRVGERENNHCLWYIQKVTSVGSVAIWKMNPKPYLTFGQGNASTGSKWWKGFYDCYDQCNKL